MKPDYDRLCSEIEGGASLKEACRAAGLSHAAVAKQLDRGGRAHSGAAHDLRVRVLASQSIFATKARAALLKAAAKGAPRAVEMVIGRMEASIAEMEIDDAPQDRPAFLRWRLAHVRRWIGQETGIARTKLLDEEREILAELEKRETEEVMDPRDRTMEQVTAEERAHAMELDPIHLQIYVAEWLGRDPQRTTLRLVTLDGTPVEILRRTA